MAAKSKTRMKVRLESSAGTGHRYYAIKNSRAEYKLKLRKYDPIAKKHVIYEEKKLPPHKK